MSALMLLGVTASALADGQAVLADAADGQMDACYSRADLRDALAQARDDQRLYSATIEVIDEARISNVERPGRPCGSGRSVPETAIPVSSSGASTVWGAAALIVVAGAVGAGAAAGRSTR